MTDRDTADLLLFATGEMPPQQQDQFAHRVAQEPALAAALTEIQSLTSRTKDWFARGERHEHPTLLEARRSAAVRKVSRGIVQKRLEDSARASVLTRKPWKRPRWAYPLATAAMLIIGLVAFVQWGSNLQLSPEDHEEAFNFGGQRSRVFHDAVYPMEDVDVDYLQVTNSYDPASMFKPDDVN